jgi:hypothetical protein
MWMRHWNVEESKMSGTFPQASGVDRPAEDAGPPEDRRQPDLPGRAVPVEPSGAVPDIPWEDGTVTPYWVAPDDARGDPTPA